MKNQWHISKSEHDKKANAVREVRLFDFDDFDVALEKFLAISHEPVYLWHDQAVGLENPYFAMVETEEYRKEYDKIYDQSES